MSKISVTVRINMSCSCHINPPCSFCTECLECIGCGNFYHEDEDVIHLDSESNVVYCDNCFEKRITVIENTDIKKGNE